MLRNSGKKVEGGEVKQSLNSQPMYLYLYNLKNSLSVDTNFLDYKLSKNFFNKNSKSPLKDLDGVNSNENLWLLNKNNSVQRVYPNFNKTLLSGNLLIGSKESEGGFNTNLVSIKSPSISAFDRYFLSLSKKNILDLSRVNRELEQSFDFSGYGGNKNSLSFFKNSDHSDMNRWLKRGWGLSEPIRLIKLSKTTADLENPLFRFRFNEKNKTLLGKNSNNIYLAFKQKRYAIRKKFPIKKKFKKLITNEVSNESVSADKLRLRVLIKNNYFVTIDEKSALSDYKFLKKAKKHSEVIPVPLARRLLRTKRTLVLPAHINLTVITNSYDVVHS